MLSKLIADWDERHPTEPARGAAPPPTSPATATASTSLTPPTTGDSFCPRPAASEQATRATFFAPEPEQGWTTLPALPHPLNLPLSARPDAAAGTYSAAPSAPTVTWMSVPGRRGLSAQVVSIEGRTRVCLPDAAYISDHLKKLRGMSMAHSKARSAQLPEKFYQALRREFFPHILVAAGQTVTAEQVADLIVYAMYSFNENDCSSVNDTLTALVPFFLAGLLPAGRADLWAAAQARFETIKPNF